MVKPENQKKLPGAFQKNKKTGTRPFGQMPVAEMFSS